jgi:hypothetical protein
MTDGGFTGFDYDWDVKSSGTLVTTLLTTEQQVLAGTSKGNYSSAGSADFLKFISILSYLNSLKLRKCFEFW